MVDTPQAAQPTPAQPDQLRRLAALFGALDKCVRATRLYQGEGDMLARMQQQLLEKSDGALSDGAVTVRLAPFGLLLEGRPLAPGEDLPPYLFRLFCDGVREITLVPGAKMDELSRLVSVLTTDVTATDEDLVTLLWRAELTHIRYYAVDSFAAGSEGQAEAASQGARRAQLDRDAEGETQLALTAGDLRVLRTEDLLEWVREAAAPMGPTESDAGDAAALAEAYRTDRGFRQFMDVTVKLGIEDESGPSNPMVLGVFDASLNAGDSEAVLDILGWLADHAEDAPPKVERLARDLLVPDRADRMAALYSLEVDRWTPTLTRLVGQGQAALVRMLSTLSPGPAETALRGVLEGASVDLTPFYLKRLESSDEAEVISAIEALGQIGSTEALAALGKALSSTLTTIRRAALEAIDGRYDPAYRVSLSRVLHDPDKGNRMLALDILRSSGDNRMCWALVSMAQDQGFLYFDADEQSAVYAALGAFKDNRVLAHLELVLTDTNITRNKAALNRQMLAVRALSNTGTDEAKELAERLRGRWLTPGPVKQALGAALASWGRTE